MSQPDKRALTAGSILALALLAYAFGLAACAASLAPHAGMAPLCQDDCQT